MLPTAAPDLEKAPVAWVGIDTSTARDRYIHCQGLTYDEEVIGWGICVPVPAAQAGVDSDATLPTATPDEEDGMQTAIKTSSGDEPAAN